MSVEFWYGYHRASHLVLMCTFQSFLRHTALMKFAERVSLGRQHIRHFSLYRVAPAVRHVLWYSCALSISLSASSFFLPFPGSHSFRWNYRAVVAQGFRACLAFLRTLIQIPPTGKITQFSLQLNYFVYRSFPEKFGVFPSSYWPVFYPLTSRPFCVPWMPGFLPTSSTNTLAVQHKWSHTMQCSITYSFLIFSRRNSTTCWNTI